MRRTVPYIALITAFLAISGCITGSYKKKYHPDNIPSRTKQYLEEMFSNVLHPEIEKQCKSAYEINQMQLIWLNCREPGQLFSQYLQQLYTLQDEGIDLGKLNINLVGRIHSQLTKWYDNQVSIPLDSIVIWDMELTKSYITAAYLLTFGDKKEVFRNDLLSQQENFRAADNLIFSVHQSDAFPALDIYRPQHFLYVQMVFALKNWMVLSGNKEYMSLKNKIRNDACSSADIWTVIRKEMGGLQSEDTISLVMKYQAKHSLPQTGVLDAATLLSLKTSPEDYRKKLKINMERLRLFSNTFPEEYFWYDIASKKFHFIRSGKIIYESNVGSTSPFVYNAPLLFRDDSSATRPAATTTLKAELRPNGTINVEGIYQDTVFREVFTLENTKYLVGSLRDPLYAGQHPADPPAFRFYKIYLTIGQDAENNVLKYLDDVLQWDNSGYSF